MPVRKRHSGDRRRTVSFDRDLVQALDELARKNGVSFSWLVRHAVSEFVETHKDQQLKLDFRITENG